MKQMTKLENIIMNRSGCNRETANLIANDILQEVEKDLQADVAREIFEEIDKIKKRLRKRQNECDKEAKKAGWYLEVRKEYEGESEGIEFCLKELAELKKKYTEGESNGNSKDM